MIILNCKDITQSFGIERILDNVTFSINEGDKVGLVGVNGAGKSTLFKIITGEILSNLGNVYISNNTKIGYMKQDFTFDTDNTIYEELFEVFKEITLLEEEIKIFEKKIENEMDEEILNSLVKEHTELLELFKDKNGYGFKSKIAGVLKGLGFNEKEFISKINTLSGGQKTRVALAKLLLEDPDLILLDEPTNHLDLNAIEWLEKYLSSLNKSFIVISHDRYFLDKVTNKILELENNKAKLFNGNYSVYTKKKEKEKEIESKKYNQQIKEIQRIEGIIKQQKQWNRERNIKMAESKMKTVDKLTREIVSPENRPLSINFNLSSSVRSGNDVLDIKNFSKEYGEKVLFENIDISIKNGEKVFMIGENGTGKSTIFKILMGNEIQTEGEYKFGANVNCSYYDQEQQYLNLNKTAITEIWDDFPKKTETEIRNSLAAFKFRGDDVFKRISDLSGGEKARISLIKIMLSNGNFLILDEPTNHLDINSREVLEQALENYDGTIFVISHDRYFINKIASKVIELEKKKTTEYLGDYDYYKEKKEKISKSMLNENIEKVVSKGKEEYTRQKEKIAQKRKFQRELEKAEEEILNTEGEIEELENKLCLEEIATDYKKSMEISTKIGELKFELGKSYVKWEELSSKV